MIAATPIIIPKIENQENIDIYPSVFLEKRNLLIINSSNVEYTTKILIQFYFLKNLELY